MNVKFLAHAKSGLTRLGGCFSALLLLAGCGGKTQTPPPAPDSDNAGHVHVAPHGGTLVELGSHEFNLEFVHVPANSALNAYVLDGHAENFVRIAAPHFEVLAKFNGREDRLIFKAVASSATGESAGSTAAFTATADWLGGEVKFDGLLPELDIRGNLYRSVQIQFPKHD